MSDFKKSTTLLLFVSFFTVFFVAVFFSAVYTLSREPSSKKIIETVLLARILPNPFMGVSLEAQAAYVFDVRTGKAFFAKNEEAQLPLASLTKVMTALVASEMPDDMTVAFGNSLTGGDKWNLKELRDYTLVVSSNEGASAIAGTLGAFFKNQPNSFVGKMTDTERFVQKMNETAKALNLSETYFLNPNGLDVNDNLSGAYGSAKDMAFLFVHILKNKPALMEATAYDSFRFYSRSGASYPGENTNIIARTIPGLLASKTGYTDLAGGNLVVAFNVGPARPIIIAVLGSTEEGRFSDVEKLVHASVIKIGQGE